MKPWITLLAVTALFSSCTKDEHLQEMPPPEIAASSPNTIGASIDDRPFATNWEMYGNWTKKDEGNFSIYYVQRKMPELTQEIIDEGLVLTYAQLKTDDANYRHFSKPVMMPFYFLPRSERPIGDAFYFFDTSTPGNITIAYKLKANKDAWPQMDGGYTLDRFKFQYVVLSKEFLERHSLDKVKVRNHYTYDEVMALVNP